MTTESSAVEKWCPFARVMLAMLDPIARTKAVLAQGVNREVQLAPTKAPEFSLLPGTTCVGRQCGFWRYATINDAALPAEESRGFCGAAGRPVELPEMQLFAARPN